MTTEISVMYGSEKVNVKLHTYLLLVIPCYPCKQDTLNQYWTNVGSVSQTVSQYWPSMGLMCGDCWDFINIL